jgi:ABC-type transport system involved in cytochrome c biogenesis ATPase subunit
LLASHLASGGMVVLTTHQEVEVVAHAVLRVDLDLHTAALLAA